MDGVGIEKFAEYCHTVAESYVDELTDGRCRCVKVEVFEHENNSAIFSSTEPSEEMKSVNQMKRSRSFTDKKKQMDQVEENTKSDVTLPPFANNTPAPVVNKKVKNKWMDPNGKSTWGI